MLKFINHTCKWDFFITPLFVSLFFQLSCSDFQKEKDQPSVQETTKTNKHMIYKFYKAKSAGLIQDQKMLEYINAFAKIYSENDVTVVGTWYDVDNPSDTYLITAFKSEQHYASFLDKMKTHDEYKRLSKEMAPDRLSIEAATLKEYSQN